MWLKPKDMNHNIKAAKAANKWNADDPKSPHPDPPKGEGIPLLPQGEGVRG